MRNRHFELAQIFATLAGFLAVATGIMYSFVINSISFQLRTIEYATDLYLKNESVAATISPSVFSALRGFQYIGSQYMLLGNFFFILGLIFILLAIIFGFYGFWKEGKKQKEAEII